MHILFLTQIIPYPLDAGPKVKTWNVLRYLVSSGHQVTLASFIRPEERPYLDVVKDLCTNVHTVEIHRSRLADIRYWLRSLFSGRPFLLERDDIREMRSLIRKLLVTEKIDVLHADQLTMSQYAIMDQNSSDMGGVISRPIRIFDAHNAVWTIIERMGQNAPIFLKVPAMLEANRIKRYEGMITTSFEHTLAVSKLDSEALLVAAEAYNDNVRREHIPITIIPIAVNTKEIQPVDRMTGSTNILTLGTLHYPPNADGIRWFIQDVFPSIKLKLPEATLTIIGKNPPSDFIQISKQDPDSILVTGYVPDLTPYLEKAAVMVVPVRAGGGMRVRILEAFARRMPVVTTTIGIEGIEASQGEEVLVTDEPAEFADAVVNLIKDGEFQEKLASKGRKLAETQYDWQVVLKKIDHIYSNN
jgi:glycosyltransferase involved in cell wall biosynthesis